MTIKDTILTILALYPNQWWRYDTICAFAYSPNLGNLTCPTKSLSSRLHELVVEDRVYTREYQDGNFIRYEYKHKPIGCGVE